MDGPTQQGISGIRSLSQNLLVKVMSDKWLRLGVLLLVLTALAYQVSLIFWHHFPSPQQSDQVPHTPAALSGNSGPSQVNFLQQANVIGKSFLFGKAQAQAVTVQPVEEAPKTKLNYKLRGVYYSTEERLSSAIIEVQANKSKHYLLDDELADNITLAGIEQDHVLINRYGKLERLNLQKPKPIVGSAQAPAQGDAIGDTSAILSAYKQRFTGNPMALATRFQAIPIQQDGKNIGFKLKALRGETLLKKLNFEPNDVFTSINGVSLKNPFEALDALKALTTASSVSVTFLRNGAEQTADFRI